MEQKRCLVQQSTTSGLISNKDVHWQFYFYPIATSVLVYDHNKDGFDLIPVTATRKTPMTPASKILESIQLNKSFLLPFYKINVKAYCKKK